MSEELKIKMQIKKLIKQNKRRDKNKENYEFIYTIYTDLKKIKSMFDDYVINKYEKLLFFETKKIYNKFESCLMEIEGIESQYLNEDSDDLTDLRFMLLDYFKIKMY